MSSDRHDDEVVGPIDAVALSEHASALYGMALREIRDRWLAEDLVQETLLAALDGAAARFEWRSSVRTWLFAILKHKINDIYRARARAPLSLDRLPETDDEDDDDGSRVALTDAGEGPRDPQFPEQFIDLERRLARFEQRLNELPGFGAAVFLLSDIHGQASNAVCAQLGISRSNLFTTLHRARQRLRSALLDDHVP